MKEHSIDKLEVLRYLGYRNQDITPDLNQKVDFIIEYCLSVAAPKTVYAVFPVEITSKGVRPGGTSILLEGHDIIAHLRGAKSCALLAATLGAATEMELRRLENQSLTDALIFDAACTALIENAADMCEAEIVDLAAKSGLYTNFRYSPGYGDFPISIQKDFITVLGAEKRIGLTVTDTSLLIPRKSVTAVIGMFEKEQQIIKAGCSDCNIYGGCAMRQGGNYCAEKR